MVKYLPLPKGHKAVLAEIDRLQRLIKEITGVNHASR